MSPQGGSLLSDTIMKSHVIARIVLIMEDQMMIREVLPVTFFHIFAAHDSSKECYISVYYTLRIRCENMQKDDRSLVKIINNQ